MGGSKANGTTNNNQQPDAAVPTKSFDDLLMELQESQKQFEDASAKLKEREDEISGLQETIEKQQETISLLNQQMTSTPQAPGNTLETFESGGVKYEVLGSVTIPGIGKRTPLEIASDQVSQAKLIEMKSGMIREIK